MLHLIVGERCLMGQLAFMEEHHAIRPMKERQPIEDILDAMEWRNTCCSVIKEQATLVAVSNRIVVQYAVLRTVPSSRQQFIICIVRDCKF